MTVLRVLGATMAAASLMLWVSAQAQQSESAAVAGIIVDDLGQPVARARVGLIDMQKSLVRSSVSNDDGRFELEAVPAGRYAVVSSKRTYVERGWDELEASAILTLEAGERRDVTATLVRGGVISGRVTHDDNTPVVGARVQVYGRFVGPAQRHLYTVIFGTTQSFTNSRGEYRLIGVPPDAYSVSVSPGSGESWGPGGMPMWTPFGFYPRASRIEDAQPVQVSAGEERPGTDIVLTQFPVVEVAVEALLPEPRTVTRMELWCGPPAFGSSGAPPENSVVSSVRVRCPVTSPGTHDLAVAVITSGDTSQQQQDGTLWGHGLVTTSNHPTTVSLAVAPGARLEGRVTTGPGLAPLLRYVDGPFLQLARIHVYPDPDAAGHFVLASLPEGRYAVTADPPAGWIATAATLDGRDVLDQVFDVPASGSIGKLNVAFAPGTTRLEGEIVTDRGVPLGHQRIAIFPADRKYWQFESRRYRATSSDDTGRYRFDALPPGDYFVTTAPDARWGVTADPRELEPLISSALRVSIEPNVVTELRVTHEIRPLNPEQARALLTAAREHRLEALLTVAVSLGLRQGEALGLPWSAVDLEAGTLSVRQSLQRVKRTWQFVEPKSERSRRTVALPGVAVSALRAHRVRQLEERLLAGSRWQDTGLVFTTSIGTPVELSNLTKEFRKLLAKAGIPRIRFHDLRHTAATLLLAQGVDPRTIMETLGHSQISLTLNTYSHVLPVLQQQAASRMNAALGG